MVLLLLGVALASAAQVVIDALEARGLKRGAALALTYGSALVLLVGAVLGLSGSFLADLRGSAESLGRTYERLSARLPEGGALAQLMAANLPSPRQLVGELTRSDPASLAGDALATSGWLLERLSAVLIVLILALHWSAAGDRLTRFGLVLIPAHRRAWTRLVLADVGQAVGRQLAGGLMKGYLALLVFAVGFRALGVPFPTLLAVIVAALAVVPLVGVLLGPGAGAGGQLEPGAGRGAVGGAGDRRADAAAGPGAGPAAAGRPPFEPGAGDRGAAGAGPGGGSAGPAGGAGGGRHPAHHRRATGARAGPCCAPTPSRACASGWTSSASRSCCPSWTAWPARWRPSPTRPASSGGGR